MRFFVTAFFVFLSSFAFAQNSHSERFRAEEIAITKMAEDGKIKVSEAAQEVLTASKVYFPTDTLTHTYYESVLSYAQRMEKNEITRERALELLELRTTRYHEALYARDREQQAAKATQSQAQAMANAEQHAQEKKFATGIFLQGVANSLRNAYGTTCGTSAYGNQALTNCR
jgi:hypothetical protein